MCLSSLVSYIGVTCDPKLFIRLKISDITFQTVFHKFFLVYSWTQFLVQEIVPGTVFFYFKSCYFKFYSSSNVFIIEFENAFLWLAEFSQNPSQQIFTGLKPTIEVLEIGVQFFKVSYKDTKTTSLARCLLGWEGCFMHQLLITVPRSVSQKYKKYYIRHLLLCFFLKTSVR